MFRQLPITISSYFALMSHKLIPMINILLDASPGVVVVVDDDDDDDNNNTDDEYFAG